MRGRRTMTRRDLLKGGALGAVGVAATAKVVGAVDKLGRLEAPHDPNTAGTVGTVTDVSLDPVAFLEEFDFGKVSTLPDGQTLRRFEIRAGDRENGGRIQPPREQHDGLLLLNHHCHSDLPSLRGESFSWSVRIWMNETLENREPENANVEHDRPVADVEEIVLNAFAEAGVAPQPVDLGPAGHA